MKNNPFNWPVLTSYDHEHLSRIALPLGGIGTGTVSLGGRGNLQDFELFDRPNKGYTPKNCFFAIRAQNANGGENGEAKTRVLEGPLPLENYEGARGVATPNHGLPRFRECSFEAAYPFGQVLLSDPAMPVKVRLQAFNPLVPGDAGASGLPLAVFRFVVSNTGSTPLRVSLCGNVTNCIGQKDTEDQITGNINQWRQSEELRGLFMSSQNVEQENARWGTMALTTTASNVTYRTAWPQLTWGDTLLDFWDDFSDDGRIENRNIRQRDGAHDPPVASLCASVEIAPGASETVTFFLTWHFPNRQTWTPHEAAPQENNIGNYYGAQFEDAWHPAEYSARQLPQLEAKTLEFVRTFCESDLPHEAKEAALFNLSTLRSQTCFRTADGRFFAWEGCYDCVGCCHGSCTHVWNYEQALAFLFGDLSRSMREIEFLHATDKNGLMSFRVNLPLKYGNEYGHAAADGQMGCLMKLFRDWQLCGEDEFLKQMWSAAKKALEFCWIKGGWDADRDGVMEGCQHNTMDVEYFGPNPQMGTWYLGALRACEEMAKHLGEDDFAAECRRLFENGSRWMDANLFNSEYYEHEIRPISNRDDIAPGLVGGVGAADFSHPELQLGAGCLIDQLVGQTMAHICGLGYLLNKTNIQTTLRSVMRHNFKDDLWEHFNHLRTFALADEAALLMASYPRGQWPERPFPYYNEVMTGFEYTAAVHMLYEDMRSEGLKVIGAIRDRYDGRKRSPFDEAECGHHYARAMASWGAITALTGFEYSGVTKTLKFAAADETKQWFWSNGQAWGTFRQTPQPGGIEVKLGVLFGRLDMRRLELRDYGSIDFEKTRCLTEGEEWSALIRV